jgi:hypothetical protein
MIRMPLGRFPAAICPAAFLPGLAAASALYAGG